MKKIMIFMIFLIFTLSLSGCILSEFRKLAKEEEIVYQSNDKKVRLEIAFKTSPIGKIYINKRGIEYSFLIEHSVVFNRFFIKIFNHDDTYIIIKLEDDFEKINYFKSDINVLYLSHKANNKKGHFIFDDFNVKLYRKKDLKVNPLNYMYVKWTSKYPKMEFVNINKEEFNKGIMSGVYGILGQEKIYIKFFENNFTVYDGYDNSIKFSGKFSFDKFNNMILNVSDVYDKYPRSIVFSYSKIR